MRSRGRAEKEDERLLSSSLLLSSLLGSGDGGGLLGSLLVGSTVDDNEVRTERRIWVWKRDERLLLGGLVLGDLALSGLLLSGSLLLGSSLLLSGGGLLSGSILSGGLLRTMVREGKVSSKKTSSNTRKRDLRNGGSLLPGAVTGRQVSTREREGGVRETYALALQLFAMGQFASSRRGAEERKGGDAHLLLLRLSSGSGPLLRRRSVVRLLLSQNDGGGERLVVDGGEVPCDRNVAHGVSDRREEVGTVGALLLESDDAVVRRGKGPFRRRIRLLEETERFPLLEVGGVGDSTVRGRAAVESCGGREGGEGREGEGDEGKLNHNCGSRGRRRGK